MLVAPWAGKVKDENSLFPGRNAPKPGTGKHAATDQGLMQMIALPDALESHRDHPDKINADESHANNCLRRERKPGKKKIQHISLQRSDKYQSRACLITRKSQATVGGASNSNYGRHIFYSEALRCFIPLTFW